MGPNIEKLVANANAGAETALTKLVERFMQGMSDEGQRQSEQMSAAASDVQTALDNMRLGLNGFLQRLNSIIQEFQSHLTGQTQAQEQQGNRRDQAIQKITKEFESTANHNQALSEKLIKAAEAFLEQVGVLCELSQSMREASTSLAGDVRKATQAAQTLMQENQRIGARSEEMLVETRELSKALSSATNTLGQTAQQSKEGLQQVEQHFNALTERLQQHSADFSEQVKRLLSDYADQVSSQTRERLNQWNEQTQQYTTTMTNAIQALSDVVEEIDGKIER